MSKMSELALCVSELQSAAQSLSKVADSLTALFSGGEPGREQKSLPTEAQSEPAPQSKQKPITLEQVRAVLADKSRRGHTADVRALLEAHGATKLSEIDPREYSALLTEAENIGSSEGLSNG